MSTPDANAVVSVESEGRILSGVGVSAESLAATMDRHASDDAPDPVTVSDSTPTADAAPPADGAPPPEGERRTETRGRKRFADLTFAAKEAERKAIAAEERAKLIERERDDLKARYEQRQQQQPEPPRQPQAPPQQAQGFTFPTYEEAVEQHPNLSYDDWRRAEMRAFVEFDKQSTDIGALVRNSIEADRANRSFLDTVERTRSKGREVYKDFDAVLRTGPGVMVQLGPDEAIATSRVNYIIQHPQSEHLQYAIMKDGQLAQSLQRMSDIDFGMAIARIAPSSASAQAASLASSGSATPPSPYQPVGSGSSTTVLPSAELAKRGGSDYDKSGYREKRAAERGLTRRR